MAERTAMKRMHTSQKIGMGLHLAIGASLPCVPVPAGSIKSTGNQQTTSTNTVTAVRAPEHGGKSCVVHVGMKDVNKRVNTHRWITKALKLLLKTVLTELEKRLYGDQTRKENGG